jgi:hypothetical protein
MLPDASTPSTVDLSTRLNAALLAQGAKELTTNRTGSIDVPMLLGELRTLGMNMTHGSQDEAGLLTATISRPAGSGDEHVIATAARTGSWSSSVVEAAIAALKAEPPGKHSAAGGD